MLNRYIQEHGKRLYGLCMTLGRNGGDCHRVCISKTGAGEGTEACELLNADSPLQTVRDEK